MHINLDLGGTLAVDRSRAGYIDRLPERRAIAGALRVCARVSGA